MKFAVMRDHLDHAISLPDFSMLRPHGPTLKTTKKKARKIRAGRNGSQPILSQDDEIKDAIGQGPLRNAHTAEGNDYINEEVGNEQVASRSSALLRFPFTAG